MVSMKKVFWILVVFITAKYSSNVVPMGEMGQQNTQEVKFVSLEEGSDILEGVIIDEGTKIELKKISISGNTTVGGIRREEDDSVSTIDLAKIRSLEVINPVYQSKRYPTLEFTLVKKVSTSGTESKLLAPRNMVICGIEKNTGDQRSWRLNKIDKVEIKKSADSHVVSKKQSKAEQVAEELKKNSK